MKLAKKVLFAALIASTMFLGGCSSTSRSSDVDFHSHEKPGYHKHKSCSHCKAGKHGKGQTCITITHAR
jgi:hypothetical protein